jgi:hypothetical protein
MSKMWHFANAWDYHEIGGFVVVAPTAKTAARRLNEWMAMPESRKRGNQNYWPGSYDKPEKGDWTADQAEEVGPVFIAGGCDD